MRAVIVAAGTGSRLREVTGGKPKGLLEVGGRPVIQRAVDALVERSVEPWIVLGHRAGEIQAAIDGPVRYLVNPFYATTNNMASLWLAVPHMRDDPFLYLHADVVFKDELLDSVLGGASEGVCLLVDPDSIDEEAMKVRLQDGRFVESSKQVPLDQAAGEWTGIARFSGQAARRFHDHAGQLLLAGQHQVYDTAAFNRMAGEGVAFQMIETGGAPWMEIDTPEDLEAARGLFPAASHREGRP